MILHHIGIVVRNMDQAISEYCDFREQRFNKNTMYIPSQNVIINFIQENDVRLEFIEPCSSNSPVYSFYQKGGGYHHLCYEVDDIDDAIMRLTKQKAKMISPPSVGFEERMTVFLFLKTNMLGINLVELAEKK